MFICKQAKAYKVEIFIGTGARGYDGALQICLDYCNEVGLCVTVTPTQYVYTGGHEPGVIVGLINYARYPSEKEDIFENARVLAMKLLTELEQGSYTIQDGETTVFHSRRPQDIGNETL